MKKTISVLTSVLLLNAAFATDTVGTCLTWLGVKAFDNTTAYCASAIGSYAGRCSWNLSYGSYVGVLAGAYAGPLAGCNAFGYGSLYMAGNSEHVLGIGSCAGYRSTYCDNSIFLGSDAGHNASFCTNCVFIGKNAGKDFAYADGAVVIGDVLVHTNGITTIKGYKGGVDSNDVVHIVEENHSFNGSGANEIDSMFSLFLNGSNLLAYDTALGYWKFNGRASSADYASEANMVTTLFDNGVNHDDVHFSSTEYGFNLSGIYSTYKFYSTDTYLKLENGYLNVYTNNIKFGTVIMKDQYANSLPIKDEDTGEKYMIKIKSGEMKLYKVND